MKNILLCICVLAVSYHSNAQCTTAPEGQFPLINFTPSCIGSPQAIDPFCKTTNYSLVSVNAGNYIFSSSVLTDYITITNSAGTIVFVHGVSPQSYNFTLSDDVRFYTHTNAACGTNTNSRTRFVECGSTPTSVPDCAFILTPTNGATNVPINPAPLASWFPLSNNAAGYKLYVGTSLANAVVVADVNQTQAAINDLQPSTTYFMYVVPYNIIGDAIGCSSNAISFTTVSVPTLTCSNSTNIAGCGINQLANFNVASGLYNPVNSSCGSATAGEEVLYTFTPAVSGNYQLNVSALSGGYVDYFFKDATAGNCENFGWTCIGAVGTTGDYPIGTLFGGTTYYLLLDKELATAGSQTFSITCPSAAPANNEATGSIPLTVDAGCTGAPFTNVNAFQSLNEPIPNCGVGGFATVWYSFVAPASGAVRVSTDLGTGNTNFDTRIAMYEATNPADYGTFNLIACDEDGGNAIGFGFMSVLYATALTPGNTYYVQVGNNDNAGGEGTFCLAVDALNSSMLSTNNACGSGFQSPFGSNVNYTGWVPLLDNSSNLIALVKNPTGGAVNLYEVAQHIHAGAVRFSTDLGTNYLNRSFRISNASAGNVQVQLFYLTSELTALQAPVPAASVGTMGVVKQEETVPGCYPDLQAANGSYVEIAQTASGTSSAVSWIEFPSNGFSNFYLKNIDDIVPITVVSFNASRQNAHRNYIYWKLSCVGSENNSIELERSVDQQSFESIYTLQNITATECSQALNFTDTHPNSGVNFYRLKFTDADGRVKYSQILSLLNGSKNFDLVSLAPNPVKDIANLQIVSDQTITVEARITNAIGIHVMSQKMLLHAGENTIPIHSSKLTAGVYQITIVGSSGVKQSLRFIKQ